MQVGERIARDRVARPGKGGGEPANAKAEQGEQAEYGGGSGQKASRKHGVVGCQQGQGDDGGETPADQSQCAGIARQRRDAAGQRRRPICASRRTPHTAPVTPTEPTAVHG